MSSGDSQPQRAGPDPSAVTTGGPAGRPATSLALLETIQALLTAVMLAFIFRAFFIEAFIIPTGSMAPTLLGQHLTMLCPVCGWEFDAGPRHRGRRPGGFVAPDFAYCPNCHTRIRVDRERAAVRNGDRILVHKWPYLVGGQLRLRPWDVIVFRDPSDATQNYIKRVVALPGETVEILDGDVFIQPPGGGELRIRRKPPHVQRHLWFVVFDQDYPPFDERFTAGSPAWLPEDDADAWHGLARRVVRFEPVDAEPHAIRFSPLGPAAHEYLQDVYGYNHGSAGNYVADVRLTATVRLSRPGWLRWEIGRDDYLFTATFDADGPVRLELRSPEGRRLEIGRHHSDALAGGRPVRLELAHVDWRVFVRVGGVEVLTTSDEQYGPDIAELRRYRRITPPTLRIVAAEGAVSLRSLRVDRDVYYTYVRRATQRAYARHPFTLADDEYFVLGDNSPNSFDSREWHTLGLHLWQAWRSEQYRVGTVRRDQIVGQAFFVYLPGLLPLDSAGRWRVPDIGRVRFVQ